MNDSLTTAWSWINCKPCSLPLVNTFPSWKCNVTVSTPAASLSNCACWRTWVSKLTVNTTLHKQYFCDVMDNKYYVHCGSLNQGCMLDTHLWVNLSHDFLYLWPSHAFAFGIISNSVLVFVLLCFTHGSPFFRCSTELLLGGGKGKSIWVFQCMEQGQGQVG